jgi:hypothetical protein
MGAIAHEPHSHGRHCASAYGRHRARALHVGTNGRAHLHMGAKETMACCQTLYQLGHITYMRTENRKYSPIFIDVASTYIRKQWTDKHVNSQLLEMHGNNDSTNPHEAIRVTNISMRDIVLIGGNDNKHVSKVYKLISLWRVGSHSPKYPRVAEIQERGLSVLVVPSCVQDRGSNECRRNP